MSLNQSEPGTGGSTSITELSALIKRSIPSEILLHYEEAISTFTPTPSCEIKKFNIHIEYNIIVFDIETTSLYRGAELCQLSAVDKTGQNMFSKYILPDDDIDYDATLVNKLSVQTVDGRRTLFKDDEALESLTCQEALSLFVEYIKDYMITSKARTNKDVCTVLIGHNAKLFDTPMLLRNSDNHIHASMRALKIIFGDSLPLFRHLIKMKHPALIQSNGQSCSSSLPSMYDTLFGETYAAHEGPEDVRALQRILFSSPIKLTEHDIIDNCKLISFEDSLKNTQYLDHRYNLLQTMKYQLYSGDNFFQAPISYSMAKKNAGSGLSYSDLQNLYTNHGRAGLIAVLSKPPTTSNNRKPRVTKNKRILASILHHFERLTVS
ncbi:uncharacterized protein LOC124437009 [Xenia sp. Carnegie-2017]|uniref:uncharacterized protein LOC124437009 n=1 Tax=Xenia sp. Carnegie-2017 TaxID=2897299 RepID=UPI001F04A7B8|nr:uncharacterized protein LOC124437009 [Xenia sp. Carnegie-2017]XP_046842973.1 uncharacterized protein LOC124437009 [Xenia sp. Carnegie-2017]